MVGWRMGLRGGDGVVGGLRGGLEGVPHGRRCG